MSTLLCWGGFGSLEALQATSGLDAVSLQHLSKVRDELGEPAIGCGLWMDGVPCQWDRDQSIEVCALSFPGAAAGTKGAGMRLPVMGLMKSQMTKSTYVDLMEVLLWSFMHLATGCWPPQRHDAQPWLASDSKRSQCTGQLGFVGCCLQIRADWAAWKGVFQFPSWNQQSTGCCWRCTIQPHETRQLEHQGLDAPWRRQRRSKMDLIHSLLSNNIPVSPMLSFPWIDQACWRLDWLHVADLGTTAGWAGSLLDLLLPKFEGRTQAQRAQTLWEKLQRWYEEAGVTDRLHSFSV